MWKIKYLGILAGICSFLAGAAQTYGNEWINYSQTYYKLNVVEDGLYHVTSSELTAAGVPVSTIAVTRYQMYRNGTEIAITVEDEDGDGRLDYLEFYGEKNDGTSDTELYVSEDAQPHTYYNLFTDSAAYFLTWYVTSNTGKRMDFSTVKSTTGLTAPSYHIATAQQLQTSTYVSGMEYGTEYDLQNPKYDYGEGWTGSGVAKGSSKSFTLSLSNAATSGTVPQLEVVMVGVSNYEHVEEIYVGASTSSLRLLGEASFEERKSYTFTSDLAWSDLASDGSLVVQISVVGVTGVSDRIAISSVKVDYPQSFDLSDSYKKYHLNAITADRGYVKVPTTSASSLSVYDVTDPLTPASVATTAYTDRLEFVYEDSASEDREFCVTSTYLTVPAITTAFMDEISIGSANYLIISHPDLDETSSGGTPVTDYVAYRKSTAGGGYDVLYADIQQVYDQFGYGQPTPAALRHFAWYAYAESDPEYLFLIGKGVTLDYSMYRDPSDVDYYVPTFGYPGSDVLFTVNEDVQDAPLYPVGRLNAVSGEQVAYYLSKVKEMESLSYNALWRKGLLNLSGGRTTSELNTFASYIDHFKTLGEEDYLGGKATNVYKNSTDEVKVINVADEINAGVCLVTFFGHSSSSLTDIEIGSVTESSNGYANSGKYPVFLVNGCNAGEIFGSTVSVGENWMLAEDLGAIGYIANSDYAYSSSLKHYSDLFYEFALNTDETFAGTMGEILTLVNSQYFENYGNDETDQIQVYQTLFQGDPAIELFGAASPDFAITADEVYESAYSGDHVLSTSDSFAINLPVRNYGKTTQDSLKVYIQRTLADGTQLESVRSFESVLYFDTLQFTIFNDDSYENQGENVFVIKLDPYDSIAELDETNNAVSFELYIYEGSTMALFPMDFATVASRSLTLQWQPADQLEDERSYSLEIDTTSQYNSSFVKNQQITGSRLLSYDLDISSLNDSTAIYWRTRFATPADEEDTSWVEVSFAITDNEPTGWGQIGHEQFENDGFTGVTYNSSTGAMTFEETSTSIQVNTHGVNSGEAYSDYKFYVDGTDYVSTESTTDSECKTNSIGAMVFDKETAVPYRPFGITSGDYSNDLVCGRYPQMINNFDESEIDTYLDSLVSSMEDGDMIVVFSFDSLTYSGWSQTAWDALVSIGVKSSTLSGLTDGQPIIFLGAKGASEGDAVEVVSDGSSDTPITEQVIQLIDEVTGKYVSGAVASPEIGPAKTWGGFHYQVHQEVNDSWSFDITGVTETGTEKVLYSALTSEVDLSSVNATTYPYLMIDFNFEDDEDRTPPTLKAWSVDYDFPPEGLLTVSDFESQSLQEGEDYTQTFLYLNISEVEYEEDSLEVTLKITNVSSGDTETTKWMILAPSPGDTTSFDVDVDTDDKTGTNNLSLSVLPDETEQYLSNNSLNISDAFDVTADDVSPVLDVTFDGVYILDGDIVSPSPTILIKVADENQYLYMEDTSGITIQLKQPCDGCTYETVNFGTSALSYVAATESSDFEVTYTPGPLDDGTYGLKVSAKDESGNESGDYEITFDVINESTVTHFYPYPNPFSTSCRFVFTLTGSTIPDQIKIQIMTVTGKVVREITQDEIGTLHIGNNVTDYAWDGRDQYGDQLANGVYLYKVFIRQDGKTLDHRDTSGDRAFKHGFGKMYILR